MTTTFVRKRHIQRETCVFWNKETRSEPGTYRVLLHRERSECWTTTGRPWVTEISEMRTFKLKKKRLPQVWVGCRLTDKTSSKAKPNRHITGHSERRMSGFRHRPRHVRSSTRSCKARGRVANSVGVWGRSGSGWVLWRSLLLCTSILPPFPSWETSGKSHLSPRLSYLSGLVSLVNECIE